MKTLAQRILDAEAVITTAKDALATVLKTAEDESRDLDDAEQIVIEEHSGTIETTTKSLDALRRAEQALSVKAKSARSDLPQTVHAKAANEKVDDVIVKLATAKFLAFMQKRNLQEVSDEIYADDARMDAVVKAATNAASTTVSGWASQLVETSIKGLLEELKPDSIYPRLAALGMSIDFGTAGSISIPRRTPGGLSGSFVQEGATIPVKQGVIASATLNRYKMGVISAFTNELARSSIPQIEGIIRDGIRTDTSKAIDTALLDKAAAVAGVRPASILSGVAGQASAGITADQILTDLKYLLNIQAAQNAGRKIVVIMNPARAIGLSTVTTANGVFPFKEDITGGTLLGATVLTSTNVLATDVIMMDAADFVTALGVPEFDVSDTATLVMIDDSGVAPTMVATGAVTAAGSVHVSGAAGTTPPSKVQSLFQTWTTSVRMVMPLSWGLLRTGTIGLITGANW